MSLNDYSKKQIIEGVKSGSIDVFSLPPKWKSDKDVGLEIVRKNPISFENLDDSLKDDEDVVLTACKLSHYCILSYASARIRGSKEFVLKALDEKDMGLMLCLVSEELQNDKEVVLKALLDPSMIVLPYASEKLRDELDVVLKAIEVNVNNVVGASSNLLRNPIVIEKCLTKKGDSLGCFPLEIGAEEKWVNLAMKQDIFSLYYASLELQNDKNLLYALKEGVKKVPKSMKTWFMERMRVLEVYEDEAWMKENRPKAPLEHQVRKF